MIGETYEGRKVFVTGHTGFKGSWLTAWLSHAGARVVGYALEPRTQRDNYVACSVAESLEESIIADVRDADALLAAVKRHRPDVVFHLAAQPLVRYSYEHPAETYGVNVLGVVNMLDAVLAVDSVEATVIITSDKCYRNNEWFWGYRETDPLGGHDPYSASKAAAETVVASHRDSFFAPAGRALSSARAGNVIGGGDWSQDRIVPDAIRALEAGQPIGIRNPSSTRPWQHVLEPLGGYLRLGAHMLADRHAHCDAYNFGPDSSAIVPVSALADAVVAAWGDGSWAQVGDGASVHEAGLLALDCSKARHELGWRPLLDWTEAVEWTVMWYRVLHDGGDVQSVVRQQIAEYETRAASAWLER